MTGLEPAASCSQSTRATNCATPRCFFVLLDLFSLYFVRPPPSHSRPVSLDTLASWTPCFWRFRYAANNTQLFAPCYPKHAPTALLCNALAHTPRLPANFEISVSYYSRCFTESQGFKDILCANGKLHSFYACIPREGVVKCFIEVKQI